MGVESSSLWDIEKHDSRVSRVFSEIFAARISAGSFEKRDISYFVRCHTDLWTFPSLTTPTSTTWEYRLAMARDRPFIPSEYFVPYDKSSHAKGSIMEVRLAASKEVLEVKVPAWKGDGERMELGQGLIGLGTSILAGQPLPASPSFTTRRLSSTHARKHSREVVVGAQRQSA